MCVVALLALATSVREVQSMPSPDPQAMDYPGWKVEEHLQKRFDETIYDCGKDAQGHPHPAFLCSGILMRSTKQSSRYHAWLPNPANEAWGVSFSWLRQDSNFPENYPSANGFIVYPWFYTPRGYAQLMVRCIYPQDAWTGGRDRCTDRAKLPERPQAPSQAICQDQGIYSDKTWLGEKTPKFTNDENQCAFGVEDGRQANTAEAWQQVVDIRRRKSIFVRNEVIVKAWPQDVGTRMPVEAFFYRDNCFYTDNDCGEGVKVGRLSRADSVAARRQAARLDQKDFLQVTGRWVPVVRWIPATAIGNRAIFDYRTEDQAVPEPKP
jgi:hypothetical protein